MNHGKRRLIVQTLALIIAGLACAHTQPRSELAGTAWQLIEIQYMDDTLVQPDDGAKYTLAFRDDGKVALRVDCNAGTGSFSSPEPGRLVFGTFATTLAVCPPDSLGPRILTDLGYVRSYLLKEGRLYLSLMADGGIYAFAPAGAAQIASRGPFAFRCEGLDELVSVTYVSLDPPHALITRGASTIVMRPARSASGAKYEGAEPDQLFWEHQGEASYREGHAQPELKCRREPNP